MHRILYKSIRINTYNILMKNYELVSDVVDFLSFFIHNKKSKK
jgi:hypothetical protein